MNRELIMFSSYLIAERGLSARTAEAYVSDLQLLFQVETNETNLVQLDSEAIGQALEVFAENFRAKSSQARAVSALKSFFKYCQAIGLREDNPTKHLETPKAARHLPYVLTPEEVEAMINTIDLSKPGGHRDRALIEVLYGCGLRISEALGIDASHCQIDNELLIVIGKGNKQRMVPLVGQAKTWLALQLKHRPDPNKPAIFQNLKGGRLSRMAAFTIVRNAAGRAGITQTISPHTLRHSYATHLVMAGVDLKAVQDLLGHASITTTEIYTHLDRSYLQETIRTFHPLSKG
jgi:integrase/recombinase XerD